MFNLTIEKEQPLGRREFILITTRPRPRVWRLIWRGPHGKPGA